MALTLILSKGVDQLFVKISIFYARISMRNVYVYRVSMVPSSP